jgi:hypothetical protein
MLEWQSNSNAAPELTARRSVGGRRTNVDMVPIRLLIYQYVPRGPRHGKIPLNSLKHGIFGCRNPEHGSFQPARKDAATNEAGKMPDIAVRLNPVGRCFLATGAVGWLH